MTDPTDPTESTEPLGATEPFEPRQAVDVDLDLVPEPIDPSGTDDRRPDGGRPGGGSAVAASVLTAVTDLVTAFGFVVGFNQLATQSPVDALLPVALLSVGIAGLVSLPAAVLGALRPAGPTPEVGQDRFLRPPGLDAGLAAFALGLLTLAALGWRWGIAAQAALVAAQGVRLLLRAEVGAVALLRRGPARPDPARVALTAVEAVLLIGFAWAALADGSIRPFA